MPLLLIFETNVVPQRPEPESVPSTHSSCRHPHSWSLLRFGASSLLGEPRELACAPPVHSFIALVSCLASGQARRVAGRVHSAGQQVRCSQTQRGPYLWTLPLVMVRVHLPHPSACPLPQPCGLPLIHGVSAEAWGLEGETVAQGDERRWWAFLEKTLTRGVWMHRFWLQGQKIRTRCSNRVYKPVMIYASSGLSHGTR